MAAAAASASKGAEESSSAGGPTLTELRACLADEKAPIAKRMRSVFFLKQMGGLPAIEAIATALVSESVLLSHEAAYVLGQMQDAKAVPFLTATLRNTKLNPIVRHEAAEALGALGLAEHAAILTEFCADSAVEVSETCKIAIARLNWINQQAKLAADAKDGAADGKTTFHSVDPAPPVKGEKNIAALQALLNDASKTLFERYRAMFSLRNINSEAAVLALASGFTGPDSIEKNGSAVFRHEICYVMGQLRHPASIPALKSRLEDKREHAMVRHEAAEALGAVSGMMEEAASKRDCEPALKKYLADGDRIVRESCDVALDISEYWATEQFDAVDAAPTNTAGSDAKSTPAAVAAAAAPAKK